MTNDDAVEATKTFFEKPDQATVNLFNWDDSYHLVGHLYHRTDGPAIETFDGVKMYFINGIEYTTKESYEAAGGTGWIPNEVDESDTLVSSDA